MQTKAPKFIAIETTGRALSDAHKAMLAQKFHLEGYETEIISFPQEKSDSNIFVENFLKGKYGEKESVGPYASSLFYILDRYDAKKSIQNALLSNKIVVAISYSARSIAEIGVQFASEEERKGFFLWSDAIEHSTFDNLRPEITFVLRDQNFQTSILSSFDSLCELFPKDYKMIDISRNGRTLDIETINSILWENIASYLPTSEKNEAINTEPIVSEDMVGTSSSNKFAIPSGLGADLKQEYIAVIDKIIQHNSNIRHKLSDIADLTEQSQGNEPVAVTISQDPNSRFATLITKYCNSTLEIPDNVTNAYSSSFNDVTLVRRYPNNELELIEDVLFDQTDLSHAEIRNESNKLNYETKHKIISSSFKNPEQQNSLLQSYSYTWELLTDIRTLMHVVNSIPGLNARPQSISPRYGFQIPKVIEDNNLTDEYTECFDQSFNIYSKLELQGYQTKASYVVLLGHKVRWRLYCNGRELIKVMSIIENYSPTNNPKIIARILEQIELSHPIMYDSLFCS